MNSGLLIWEERESEGIGSGSSRYVMNPKVLPTTRSPYFHEEAFVRCWFISGLGVYMDFVRFAISKELKLAVTYTLLSQFWQICKLSANVHIAVLMITFTHKVGILNSFLNS